MSPRRAPLRIAVVGHTNTGKTSLLRTLSRERGFGEVSDRPATTREVQGIALLVAGEPRIELYDTPGLEAAGDLYEHLDVRTEDRHQGPERIERLLRSPEAQARFAQEARVLRQLLASDVAIYVIDAREPVLGKYQDELAVLAQCALPVLPVLNFTAADEHRAQEWREALARVNLHTVAAFDTVVFSLAAELRLWDRLRVLLERHEDLLQALMDERRREADWRVRAATRRAAAFLLDVAAFRLRVRLDDSARREAAREEMQARVRTHERLCVDDLLELYRFGETDYEDRALVLEQGSWRVDPFDPEALKRYGLLTGKSTALGAAAGAAVDVATGGLLLGAGTATGTALGAGFAGWRSFGRELRERVAGYQGWIVTDAALRLLAMRQQALLAALQRRGHAAWQPIVASHSGADLWREGRLPAPLRRARLYPNWSAMQESAAGRASLERESAIDELAATLLDALEIATPASPAQ